MLYKQQKRLIENLIFPVITNFENYFKDTLNSSYNKLYSKFIISLSISEVINEDKDPVSFVLNTDDTNIFLSTFRLFFLVTQRIDTEKNLSHIYSEHAKEYSHDLCDKVRSVIDRDSNTSIPLKEILSNPVLCSSYIRWCEGWYKPLVEFLITWKKAYIKKHSSHKRTLDSLIDSW